MFVTIITNIISQQKIIHSKQRGEKIIKEQAVKATKYGSHPKNKAAKLDSANKTEVGNQDLVYVTVPHRD